MSPLLDSKVIDKYVPRSVEGKIKKIRNNYFDGNVIKELSEKEELTEPEKNRLYSGLIRNKLIFDCTVDADEVVKKMLSKYKATDKNRSIKPLSDIELQFLAFYFIRCNIEKFNVFITDEHPNISFKEQNGMIKINREAIDNANIEDFIRTANYASIVAEKYNIPTLNLVTQYEIALDKLFLKYLDEADYAAYVKYYKYSMIDYVCKFNGDARAASNIGIHTQRDDLVNLIMKKCIKSGECHDKALYLKDFGFKPYMAANKQDLPTLEFPADSFIIRRLDRIIKEHPEELKNYSVLTKFYNDDGARKSFKKIFNLRMNDNKNFVHIYDSFINRGILDGGLSLHVNEQGDSYEKFPLPDNENEIYKVFDLLAKINENKAENLNILLSIPSSGDYKGEEYYSTPLGYTVMGYINQITEIQDYVRRNSSTLINILKKKGAINQESVLYSFVKNLRNIDLAKITNPSLLNDNFVVFSLIGLIAINNDLVKIFNKAFVDQLMEQVSDEDKNRLFYKESGEPMKFEDFIYNEVLPNMNAGLEYTNGNFKMHVKSLIRQYTEPSNDEENKPKKH